MSDLLLNFANIIVGIFEVDLFDGYNLARLFVHGLVDGTEGAGADLFEKLILLGKFLAGCDRLGW